MTYRYRVRGLGWRRKRDSFVFDFLPKARYHPCAWLARVPYRRSVSGTSVRDPSNGELLTGGVAASVLIMSYFRKVEMSG